MRFHQQKALFRYEKKYNLLLCLQSDFLSFFMLSASTDLPQVQSYHNQYFYSLDFALFINKKQNKGGESLPLAHTTLLATPSSGAKFILTQPRNAPKLTVQAGTDLENLS